MSGEQNTKLPPQEEEVNNPPGVTMETLSLKSEIGKKAMSQVTTLALGEEYQLEACCGADSLWLFIRRENAGALALRTAYSPGEVLEAEFKSDGKNGGEFQVKSALGNFRITLEMPEPGKALLHCTTALTPDTDLILSYWPRDLFPLDAADDPTGARGEVLAAQRAVNTALLYGRLTEPGFGSFFYLQNLTALNAFFSATGSKPDGVVGGLWPELGYKMPITEGKPLKQGEAIILSDVYLNLTPDSDGDQRTIGKRFLDLLADIYLHLEKPDCPFYDWSRRAEETLRDLKNSPKAIVKQHGYTYLHPYTDSEYPDSMVQLAVLLPILEYAQWRGKPEPFADTLRQAVPNFFDIELKILRRYLASVGSDKDSEESDSWYLYHPLINLARLAREFGDEEAKKLFLESLPASIKIAQHFEYSWPVLYNIRTLEVSKRERKEGEPGQTDVGGIYAHVMLQAYQLTQEALYLEEAKKAIQAMRDMQFETVYQTNVTAYGITACLWIWDITKEQFYLEQSYTLMASYFHNTLLWSSQIGTAKHFMHFMGATCLHDSLYMAAYECFESYTAFYIALDLAENDLPVSARLLLTEFCKYALGRLRYFYPDQLPSEDLATEIRNGHIDSKLAFPLEDLYADGQPAGQVGQEIYGAGAAFALTARAFCRMEKAPFLLYFEYPLRDIQEEEGGIIRFRLHGKDGLTCRIRAIPTTSEPMPSMTLERDGGEVSSSLADEQGHTTGEGHCEFTVEADRKYILRWSAA